MAKPFFVLPARHILLFMILHYNSSNFRKVLKFIMNQLFQNFIVLKNPLFLTSEKICFSFSTFIKYMQAAAILFHHDPCSSDTNLLISDSIKQAYPMKKYRELLFITTTEKPLPVLEIHSISGKKKRGRSCLPSLLQTFWLKGITATLNGDMSLPH